MCFSSICGFNSFDEFSSSYFNGFNEIYSDSTFWTNFFAVLKIASYFTIIIPLAVYSVNCLLGRVSSSSPDPEQDARIIQVSQVKFQQNRADNKALVVTVNTGDQKDPSVTQDSSENAAVVSYTSALAATTKSCSQRLGEVLPVDGAVIVQFELHVDGPSSKESMTSSLRIQRSESAIQIEARTEMPKAIADSPLSRVFAFSNSQSQTLSLFTKDWSLRILKEMGASKRCPIALNVFKHIIPHLENIVLPTGKEFHHSSIRVLYVGSNQFQHIGANMGIRGLYDLKGQNFPWSSMSVTNEKNSVIDNILNQYGFVRSRNHFERNNRPIGHSPRMLTNGSGPLIEEIIDEAP